MTRVSILYRHRMDRIWMTKRSPATKAQDKIRNISEQGLPYKQKQHILASSHPITPSLKREVRALTNRIRTNEHADTT